MMYHYGDFGFMPFGFLGLIGLFIAILWWALVIFAIVSFIKWLRGHAPGRQGHWKQSPLDIVKERYARGEISKKDFEEVRRDLSD